MVGAALLIFAVACVLPLAYMLASSWGSHGRDGSNASLLLLDARQRRLLVNTAMLGLGTAVCATAIGAPLGIVLARLHLPWKPVWRMLLAAPMLLPAYVAGLAWVSLANVAVLADLIGRDMLSAWIYSLPAAILVQTLVLFPVSMLATEATLRQIEPRLEEAGLIVARPHRVLWHITARLAAPGVLAAALMIFVLAISEFAVPGLLRVRVFTTEVFTAFAALYDFGRATLLTLPLLLLSTITAAIAVVVVGDRLVTTRRGGTAQGESSFAEMWRPASIWAAILVLALSLILPIAVLVQETRAVRSWGAVVDGSGGAIANSLRVAIVGATLTTGLGFCLGYARARGSRRIGILANILFVVLFAVPSTVVGVGLIGLWNRPGVLGAIYGTSAMLVLVTLARFLPLASLAFSAAVAQVPPAQEEAAATAGAGWMRTMARIVAPQVRASALAVWVVVFVLAFGELGASILVAPPGEATLPIRIYTLIANSPPGEVAALALLQTTVILAPLVLLTAAVAARRAA